jgi:hypothetical protein
MDGGQFYEGHPSARNLVDYTDAERARGMFTGYHRVGHLRVDLLSEATRWQQNASDQ